MRRFLKTGIASVALAGVLTLAGCANDGDSGSSNASPGGSEDGNEPGGDAQPGARSCQATAGPVTPKTIFHIGHSLTDRMAPLLNYLLEADSGESVDYLYKTSTGTSIETHWNNPHSNAKGNMGSASPLSQLQTPGQFDVLSMTERLPMSPGKGEHADSWAGEFLANSTNPNPEVFIYSTWNQRNPGAPDTPQTIQAWMDSFAEWEPLWEDIAQSVVEAHPNASVGIIPAGRVLEELQQRVLDGALVLPNGLTFRETFFKRNSPGRYGGCDTRDHIHMSRAGLYAVALTHYATLFCASPIGLPSVISYPGYSDRCIEADEVAIDPGLAAEIQEVVWQVVRDYPWAGVD